MSCITCRFENDSQSRFCIQCGHFLSSNTTEEPQIEDQVVSCTICQFENDSQSRFCIQCGHSLTAGIPKAPKTVGDQGLFTREAGSNTDLEELDEIPTPKVSEEDIEFESLIDELRNIAFSTQLLKEAGLDSDELTSRLAAGLDVRRLELERRIANRLEQKILQIRQTRDFSVIPSRIRYFLDVVEKNVSQKPGLLQDSNVYKLIRNYGWQTAFSSSVSEHKEDNKVNYPTSEKVSTAPMVSSSRPAPLIRSPRINWGDILVRVFSENVMSSALSFGVVLIAISSLVLIVRLWSTSDWWIKQLFFLAQMVAFVGAGHILKERLGLHLSGLALITIGAIWALFNSGVAVYEFIGSTGNIVIPGIDLPIDLPLYGWLIIVGVASPIWVFLSYKYQGHLLTQGTVALIGASSCLMIASLGASWQWSVLPLTILASGLLVVWKRLVRTSHKRIVSPLFWTAHVVGGTATLALLGSWAVGGPGYPFAMAVVTLTIFSGTALRFTNIRWYEYAIAGLSVSSILLLLSESGVIGVEYFDGVIVSLAALCLLVETKLKFFSPYSLEDEWKVLRPFNLVGLLLLIVALCWPELAAWSRTLSMFAATVITFSMSHLWRRDPWPWIPLIPLSFGTFLFVEAADLPQDTLLLYGVFLGFLGLGVGHVLRKDNIFAVPSFSWSIGLSVISILLVFWLWDPDVHRYSMPALIALLACQSVFILRSPLATLRSEATELRIISVHQVVNRHICVWASALFGTATLFFTPIWISVVLLSFGVQDVVPSAGAFLAVGWSIVVLALARYLLARVSKLHEWGAWIVAGVSAAMSLILVLEQADQYGFTLVAYGLVVVTVLYRLLTRWTGFSWLITVFVGASIANTLELTGLVIWGHWGGPNLGIFALGYLVGSVVLGSREKDGFGPLAASGLLMVVSVIWSASISDSVVASVGFSLGAVYFAALTWITWVDRAICRTCSLEFDFQNRFCIHCGTLLSGRGKWVPLSFIEGRVFPYLSSTFLFLSGMFLVGTSASLLDVLDVGKDIQAYALLVWATLFSITPWALRARVSGIRFAAANVATLFLGCVSVAILLGNGTSLALTITLYYLASLSMVYRLHFRNPLPLYVGFLLLAGAFLETLLYVGGGYLFATILWSVLAITAVSTGLMLEKLSIRDSFPAYLLAILAIIAGEWVAWGNTDAQIVILGSLIILASCTAWLSHKKRFNGLEWTLSSLTHSSTDITRGYLTTGLIALATLASPVWVIQMGYLFSATDEMIGISLSLLSVLFFLIGGLIGRAQKKYAVPLQAIAMVTATAGPFMASGSEYYRSGSLWLSAGAFGICLLVFRRWYWLYPVLIATHLAVVSSLYIPQFDDLDIHKKGLIFGVFGLAIVGSLGFAFTRLRELSGDISGVLNYKIFPFVIFASVDIAASLIVSGWADWANWEGLLLSTIYTSLSVVTAHVTRGKYIPYVAVILLTVSIGFLSGMLGDGLGVRAVAWAAQGLILWWFGRAVQRVSRNKTFEWLSIWTSPLLNSGTRLSWFAAAFVVVTVFLEVTLLAEIESGLNQATAVMSILGLLYLGMTVYHRRPVFGYISSAALILSWYLQIVDKDVSHIQFYAIPAGLYLLGLAFFEEKRTEKWNLLGATMNVMGATVLAGSAFAQSVLDKPEWLYVTIVGVEGGLLVLWGAISKARGPFICGITAFFINVLYQATSLLSSLNTAVVTLVIGILLVASVILVERFRSTLIRTGRRWLIRLEGWSW